MSWLCSDDICLSCSVEGIAFKTGELIATVLKITAIEQCNRKPNGTFLWCCVDASLGSGRVTIKKIVRSRQCTEQSRTIPFAKVQLDRKFAQL